MKRSSFVVVAGLLLAGLLAGGCIAPRTVYVPHPMRVQPQIGLERLVDLYTASADTDPAGLGGWEGFYQDSTFTLVVWPMQQSLLERDRLAFMRDEAEQKQVEARLAAWYRENLVLVGRLRGADKPGVSVERYQQGGGLFLMDDTGRKFYPVKVDDRGLEQVAGGRILANLEKGRAGAVLKEPVEMLEMNTSQPLLLFPASALTAQTRSLSLYFAEDGRQARFTWVFQEEVARRRMASGEERHGLGRLWRLPR